jgi:hypothetical protein
MYLETFDNLLMFLGKFFDARTDYGAVAANVRQHVFWRFVLEL